MDVTLEQMLAAREARAARQVSLNRMYHLPILSFSMNIPGPVKDTPLIRRGFLAGCGELDKKLIKVRHRQIIQAVTGWEAVYAVEMDSLELKSLTTDIEDTHPLGRLFDMDVLDTDLHKLDRELVGGKSRGCIVCGAPGRGCASRRTHSVAQLQQAVSSIMEGYFRSGDARAIGRWAVESLLDEVNTTPKPGLVDLRNNGSHRDMDPELFYASAQALEPYFCRCAEIGQETAHLQPEETFSLLRAAGLEAEKTMYAATNGVNTHKGAIFTMGLLCGAAGRLWRPEGVWNEAELLDQVAAMTQDAMAEDLRRATGKSAGEQLYLKQGTWGIRGEAARGFPSVQKIGLPAYRNGLRQGLSANDAGVLALLHFITAVEDTCLLHRGGPEKAAAAKARVQALLEASPVPNMADVETLDDWFIRHRLSPGGCADLLAAVYFLEYLS